MADERRRYSVQDKFVEELESCKRGKSWRAWEFSDSFALVDLLEDPQDSSSILQHSPGPLWPSFWNSRHEFPATWFFRKAKSF